MITGEQKGFWNMRCFEPRRIGPFLSVAILLALFTITSGSAYAAATTHTTPAPLQTPTIQGDLAAHDPSLIKQGNTYYVFSTGGGIEIRTSPDLVTWTRAGSVFSSIPTWVTNIVGNITDLWAPDIHYVNGTYYLYYAGSTFGSNNSVIGLATNTTLNPSDPHYHWVDHGLVLQSTTSDNYNAIDPNLAFDTNNTPWLAFGSFWSGLKLRRLDPSTMKPSTTDTTIYSLAERPSPDAIEASYIVYHGGYYYLFASVDYCCKGVNSTYKIAVGRSRNITGPYVSQAGTPMLQGGYTILLQSSGNVIGPGGQSVYHDGNRDLLIHHYYDGSANGAVKIQIRQINWSSDGWLQLSTPIS
jgi:arabinan endo-1,5-alpha-L-arabinosidase